MKRWLSAILAGVAVPAAVLLASSCTGTDGTNPVTDATDAPPDQSVGPTDAGKDAREASAPVDAGPFDIAGEWEKVPGTPSQCPVWSLRNPEVIPAFPWKACANGRVDCQSFTSDWNTKGTVHAFLPQAELPAHETPQGVYVAYGRGTSASEKYIYHVLQSMDAPASAAFALPRSTCASTFGGNQFGFSLGLYFETEGSFLAVSPRAQPSGWVVNPAKVRPNLDVFTGTTPVPGGVLVTHTVLGGSGYAARYDVQSKAFFGPGPMSEQPRKLGDGFVALIAGTPPVIGYVPPAGGYQVLRRPAAGHGFFYVAIDQGTSDIVWVEDDGNQNMTIWTSPAATTEAAMQPRRVAKVAFVSQVVAKNGVAAIIVNEQQARLIRLSDGLGWDLPTDEGLKLSNPLWINDEAVWLLASRRYNGGFPFNAGIRYARNALGPPTVPSGL